jgi:phage shock protein A
VTKKQLKQLAKKLADYEYTIQTSNDPYKVNEAKDRISQLTESSDLEIEDMVALDDMIQKILSEKI